MTYIHWERYPLVEYHPQGCAWLTIQSNLGLVTNTIDSYGRALQDFFVFCDQHDIDIYLVRKNHIALYIHELRQHTTRKAIGLSNATIQQRLTVVRLFYDYLREEGIRDDHPVGRGRTHTRGLIPRQHPLPWIPTDAQWLHLLDVMRSESIRNRTMFALAYDAGLRREELCLLEIRDIDRANRLLHIRAETTKNRLARVIPYSTTTASLYSIYLIHRRQLSHERGVLFLSESRRNYAQPITIWTWSKVINRIAQEVELNNFSTHTLCHLCLTDLAR